jgi:hypothetical protein
MTNQYAHTNMLIDAHDFLWQLKYMPELGDELENCN